MSGPLEDIMDHDHFDRRNDEPDAFADLANREGFDLYRNGCKQRINCRCPHSRDPYASADVVAPPTETVVRIFETRAGKRLERLNRSDRFCRSEAHSRSGNGSLRIKILVAPSIVPPNTGRSVDELGIRTRADG